MMIAQSHSATAASATRTCVRPAPAQVESPSLPTESWEPSNALESTFAYGTPLLAATLGAASGLAPFFGDSLLMRYGLPAAGMAISGAMMGAMISEQTDDVFGNGAAPKYVKNAAIGAVAGAALGTVMAGSPLPVVVSAFGGFMTGSLGVLYATEGFK